MSACQHAYISSHLVFYSILHKMEKPNHCRSICAVKTHLHCEDVCLKVLEWKSDRHWGVGVGCWVEGGKLQTALIQQQWRKAAIHFFNCVKFIKVVRNIKCIKVNFCTCYSQWVKKWKPWANWLLLWFDIIRTKVTYYIFPFFFIGYEF